MKTIYVSKPVPVTRFSLNWLWLAIASVLRRLNAGYDDYEIRLHMGELTADEARAEIVGDFENAEWNRLAGEAWSDVLDKDY